MSLTHYDNTDSCRFELDHLLPAGYSGENYHISYSQDGPCSWPIEYYGWWRFVHLYSSRDRIWKVRTAISMGAMVENFNADLIS